jgi:glucoamylase
MGRHPTTSGTSEQISTLPRAWTWSNRLLGLSLSVAFFLTPILFFQWPWQFSFGLKHYRLRIIAEQFFAYKEWLWTSIYPILQRIQKTTLPSMRSILLTALAFYAAVFAQNAAVDQFVATQYPISKAGVLANIGPSGSKSSGAKVCFCFMPTFLVFKINLQAGVVIASPSKSNPDYLYTWARDSALVYKAIIDL